jgi:hypothetical protein
VRKQATEISEMHKLFILALAFACVGCFGQGTDEEPKFAGNITDSHIIAGL